MGEMVEVAKKAAIEAGKITLELRSKLKIKSKSNQSDIVTQADTASEKVILKILDKIYPNHSYLSEEEGEENKNLRRIRLVSELFSNWTGFTDWIIFNRPITGYFINST